jgi:hypothetical protein
MLLTIWFHWVKNINFVQHYLNPQILIITETGNNFLNDGQILLAISKFRYLNAQFRKLAMYKVS